MSAIDCVPLGGADQLSGGDSFRPSHVNWLGMAAFSLEVSEVAQFQNLNTPEDWAAHAGK